MAAFFAQMAKDQLQQQAMTAAAGALGGTAVGGTAGGAATTQDTSWKTSTKLKMAALFFLVAGAGMILYIYFVQFPKLKKAYIEELKKNNFPVPTSFFKLLIINFKILFNKNLRIFLLIAVACGAAGLGLGYLGFQKAKAELVGM